MNMSQQNDYLSLKSDKFVSNIDYSEARNILDLTTIKQKQLRRQRRQPLHTQLLLQRTYTHVCQLLDSDCSIENSLPLSTVDTNKRKFSSDDHEVPSITKKSKGVVHYDILRFLCELKAVKVIPRY
jgi:hypothetical protein